MKNNYEVIGNTIRIYFRNTKGFFLIDADDFEKISRYTWYRNVSGYAESSETRNGELVHIKAHHIILGKPPEGLVTDHINRDRLDNRKINLRHVTYSMNNSNRTISDKKAELITNNPYYGIKVYKGKKKTSYYVCLHDANNVGVHYGNYETLEEAQAKRNEILTKKNAG